MLKKLYANVAYKKSIIFAAAFVITSILFSNWCTSDESLLDSTVSAVTAGMVRLPVIGSLEEQTQNENSDAMEAAKEADHPSPTGSPPEFVYSSSIPMSYELQEYTYLKSKEHDLEYEMVLAVMWRESRFDPGALCYNNNGTVDSGIMQINEINNQWLREEYGLNDMMDPKQNIAAGTAILGNYKKKFGEQGALLAYQYGETGYLAKVDNGEVSSEVLVPLESKRDQFREILQE